MNKIVLTVLKEYFEHTTGDVTLEQIETCAQAISEALEAAQQGAQRTGLCPECDSEILDTGYCMMGHWVGTPAANASLDPENQ